jgi:hypothetical protein
MIDPMVAAISAKNDIEDSGEKEEEEKDVVKDDS